MKKLLLLINCLLIAIVLQGQDTILQIDQGENYSHSVYLDLATGSQTRVSDTIWDIAFATGNRSVSVLLNEAALSGEKSRPLQLFVTSATDFSQVDTTFITDTLYNGENSWQDGGFNSAKDTTNGFDFGWGIYNPATHIVTGNRFFIIRLRDGSYHKIRIDEYNNQQYIFTYAELNGGALVTDTISVSDYAGRTLAYYSLKNQKTLDLEPDSWDLKFTRYNTPIEDSPGEFLNYQVTGALIHPEAEVAVVSGVDPALVSYKNYEDSLTKSIDAIGYEWKFFDRTTFQYSIVEDQVYFIKTPENEVYKLRFLDFEGSSTGVSTLRITLEEVLSSTFPEPEYINNAKIFPNPVTGNTVRVVLNSGELRKNVTLGVWSMEGRLVYTENSYITPGANSYTLHLDTGPGMYICAIQTVDGIITLPFIKP